MFRNTLALTACATAPTPAPRALMTAPAPISFDGNVAARLAPTNFHLPPGANANFQQVAPGQVTPQTLGLLLWGATEQAETSPVGTDGMPLLSGEVMQHADYPAAANGGKPNPELLAIQFKAGDKVGLYRPTVELIGGNAVQFTIEAKVPGVAGPNGAPSYGSGVSRFKQADAKWASIKND